MCHHVWPDKYFKSIIIFHLVPCVCGEYVYLIVVVAVAVVCAVCAWSVLSYLHVDSKNQTQVVRLVWCITLAAKPFHRLQFDFEL